MEHEQLNQTPDQNQGLSLPNLLAVVEYFRDKGWKITKSPAYRHSNESKIRSQPDGTLLVTDAEKYARLFLKRKDASKSGVPKKIESLQTNNQAAEAKKVAAQAKHWEIKTKILEGKFVDRAEFEWALAARASIFKTDMENFFRSQAGEMINLVQGDSLKALDLID
jgi:hypothetical protein